MSSDPYTPDETELVDCYAASLHEHAGEDYATAKADAERGIQAIKADARAGAMIRGAEIGWDAAVDAMQFEDGTKPDLVAVVNPYRPKEENND